MSSTTLYAASGSQLTITSVDTMKESMDTSASPLSDAQITDDVNLSARLNPMYITVDTYMDYPAYMQRWVNAVRATGRHVWFRIHPNQWEDNNGATGIMTPAAYEATERAFILAHPALFQPGDILDPCPEPENGHYWVATYGSNWSWQPQYPNAATRDYNAFIRDTTTIADTALHQLGINGVITTVRSTNSWFDLNSGALEPATVSMMGRVTVDSYPDAETTDPATAANLRVQELAAIYAIWHLPIVIGEMGYSNKINVDDATQDRVLKAEFAALSNLPYLAGINYWVGAGTWYSGGYTHLFNGSTGNWTLRPAAADVAAFFGAASVSTATPVVTATQSTAPSSSPTQSPTRTNPPTVAATSTPTVPPTATAVSGAVAGGCASGWTCGDVGGPYLAGSQTYSNGTWTVQGAGWDLWLTSGQFHYVWQTLAGNGSLSARIISQSPTNGWAKAGLLISASTDPQAAHYAVFMTPSGLLVQYRTVTGAAAQKAALVHGTPPLYLKIVRAGATFTAYTSSNGLTWGPVSGSSATLAVSGPLLAGMAVTSHNSGVLGTAVFDSVGLQ
jgi:hypothetical protein